MIRLGDLLSLNDFKKSYDVKTFFFGKTMNGFMCRIDFKDGSYKILRELINTRSLIDEKM